MPRIAQERSVEQVIADMLVEPTGRHMLDSGGAYGRNWERNQGKTLEDFKAEPEATIDKWSCVNISVFHYLSKALEEYDAVRDTAFYEWADATAERRDQPWLALMGEYAEEQNDGSRGDGTGGFNSYNGECFLSQTLQGEWWTEDGDTYMLLSIHGGCDVRGGYTAPHVFKVYDECGMPDLICYYADAEFWVEGRIPPVSEDQTTLDGSEPPRDFIHYDMRGGYIESYRDGEQMPEDDPMSLDKGDFESNGWTWDEDNSRWKAPDGNGYLCVGMSSSISY